MKFVTPMTASKMFWTKIKFEFSEKAKQKEHKLDKLQKKLTFIGKNKSLVTKILFIGSEYFLICKKIFVLYIKIGNIQK